MGKVRLKSYFLSILLSTIIGAILVGVGLTISERVIGYRTPGMIIGLLLTFLIANKLEKRLKL